MGGKGSIGERENLVGGSSLQLASIVVFALTSGRKEPFLDK